MANTVTTTQDFYTYLNRVCDGLLSGHLQLWQLPTSVANLYYLGESYGRQQLEPELRETRRDRDAYYAAASRGGFAVPIIRSQGKAYWELLEARGQHEAALRARADFDRLQFDREALV